MIRLREITGDERLLGQFVDQYPGHSGFPLSMAYARRCRAYAFMDGDAMVGGFFLNSTAPFRSLENMPDEDRRRVMATLDLDQTFEPMCFWMARSVRGGLRMMWFWAIVLYVIRRFPKRDLLACTVSRSLRDLYATVPTMRLLYEGRIDMPDRALPKYVFVVRGKRGLLRGLVMETARRVLRGLVPRLVPARLPATRREATA